MITAYEKVSVRFLSAHDLIREKGKLETVNKNSYYAISIRISGEAEFSIGGRIIHAGRGGVLIIPPNLHYSQYTEGERIIAIHFEALECYESESIEYLNVDNWDFIVDQFLVIWKLNAEKPSGWYYNAMTMLYSLLKTLHDSSDGKVKRNDDSIDTAALHLEEHYAEHTLTVKRLSEIAGYSEAYFRRLYQDRYKTTPSERISYLRLERAKRLLELGKLTMTEIAEEIGIGEAKYFSTWFRQNTGMSPRNYVKSLRG